MDRENSGLLLKRHLKSWLFYVQIVTFRIRGFVSGQLASEEEDYLLKMTFDPGPEFKVRTDENIARIKAIVDEDPHCSIKEIAHESGISTGSVERILTIDLQMRKLCARWIPHKHRFSAIDTSKNVQRILKGI